MERANNPDEVWRRWESYKLPKNLEGKKFLDVGCWAGGFVREALVRDASLAVGIDSVSHEKWKDARTREFYKQMDIYSPHFFSMPRYDVVLCAGVLYHVPDVVGLLHRLKCVVKDDGHLYIESAYNKSDVEFSLSYCRADSFDGNFSNWFVPSEGFTFLCSELGLIVVDSFDVSPGRVMWVLEVSKHTPVKYLPRKRRV